MVKFTAVYFALTFISAFPSTTSLRSSLQFSYMHTCDIINLLLLSQDLLHYCQQLLFFHVEEITYLLNRVEFLQLCVVNVGNRHRFSSFSSELESAKHRDASARYLTSPYIFVC